MPGPCSAGLKMKRPEPRGSVRAFFLPCPLRGLQLENEAVSALRERARKTRPSRCRPLWPAQMLRPQTHCTKIVSAAAPSGGNWPARAPASGIAARAVAAHCAKARRNSGRSLAAHPAPAASGLAPGTPDSNTAPSSRACIASSVCLTSFVPATGRGQSWPPNRPVQPLLSCEAGGIVRCQV